MNITVWKNFKKRKNSTLQPANTGTTITNVRLKDNCNYENPVFLLNQIDFDINYIQAFGKYYYVESIDILSADHAAYNCTMDLLASYKSDIQNVTAFVERSASANNKYIVDEMVQIYPNSQITLEAFSGFSFSSTGCYIVQIVTDTSNNGAVTSFAMTQTQLSNLTTWLNAQDGNFINWVMLQYGSAMDWIVNCFWIPISVSDITGSDVHIKAGPGGNIDTGVSARMITGSGLLTFGPATASLSALPDDFRRNERYVNVSTYLPHYGLVNLPISKLRKGGSVRLTAYVDLFTGQVFYKIDCQADNKIEYIATVTSTAASQVPLAQQNAGVAVGLASTVISTGISIASKDVLGGLSGIESVAQKVLDPGINIKGSYDGKAMRTETDAYIFIQQSDTGSLIEPNATHGRPLHESRTLSSLSGFVKCNAASVSCDATNAQTSAINQMLNSGIFLE